MKFIIYQCEEAGEMAVNKMSEVWARGPVFWSPIPMQKSETLKPKSLTPGI